MASETTVHVCRMALIGATGPATRPACPVRPRLYSRGRPGQAIPVGVKPMPVYVLFRGDCNNLVHEQTGKPPFVATDAMGREWLCIETDQAEIGSVLPPAVAETLQAQRAAHRQGFSQEGTEIRQMDCPDEETLRRSLIEETGPSSGELQARLSLAGWTEVQFQWETGKPFRLTLGNGKTAFTVEAASEKEAWRLAAREKLTMESDHPRIPRPPSQGRTRRGSGRGLAPDARRDDSGVFEGDVAGRNRPRLLDAPSWRTFTPSSPTTSATTGR